MKNFLIMMRRYFLLIVFLMAAQHVMAQPGQGWDQAQLEAVEIDIVKEREITLPEADRNFEKIPPRSSEPIKPPIQYDFRAFSFQTSQINPAIRPLKLKQENPSKVYGGHFSAGYGNYASPYLD